MTKLFVDSDGCPVREESIKVASRNSVETFLVCAGGIRPYENPLVQIIFVKEGLDSADDWIVENIEANDIAVTLDIPLAGRCIAKGALVVKPNGVVPPPTFEPSVLYGFCRITSVASSCNRRHFDISAFQQAVFRGSVH